jgi:sulfonate transport system substrate-binding protein
MNILKLSSLVLALLASLSLGCRTIHPSSEGRISLVVAGRGNLVYAPVTLAESLGYFRSENLDVVVSDTTGGSKALQALLGGSADVACGFYDHTIQMAAEGQDLTAFVLLSTSYAEAIVISPRAAHRIDKLEDLKGANIGVTAPGSSTHFFVNYVLGQHGVSTNEFTVLGTGSGPSRITALEQGKVDAGVVLEPSLSYLSLRNPGLKIFADTRTPEGSREVLGSAIYPTAVLYSTERWLKQNPKLAHGLAQAMVRTLRWIDGHSPEDFVQAISTELKGEDPVAYLEAVRRTRSIFSRDGVFPHEGAEAVLRMMKATHEKVRESNVDLAGTYTNRFVSSP